MASSASHIPKPRKFALIIANSNYSRPDNRLTQSVENARALGDSLKKIGFNVTTKLDLKKHEMTTQIIDFSNMVRNGDLVLVYFCGYGYQVNGSNYIIPVGDAQIERDRDVEDFAIDFRRIFERFLEKNSSYVNLFILDCSGAYSMQSRTASTSTANSKGLVEIKRTDGAFIQFACGANETVRDNLFTKHLIRHITEENVNIVDLFQRITDGVYQERNRKQRPLSINGLRQHQDIYLNQVIPPPQVWDEIKPGEKQSILKKQEELRACYDAFPDIDDVTNRDRPDIKQAEELTRSILSQLPSGNSSDQITTCHAIKNLLGGDNEECLFFDSTKGTRLHDACRNLGDIDVKDKPFVLKLNSNDDFVIGKDPKDSQLDLKVIKTLDRVIAQNESHPVTDEIIERLAKAHNTDKKNIVLKAAYQGSCNLVYSVMDLASDVIKKLSGLSKKLKEQFKQFKAAKIHPLLYRPSFDISQFDPRGNKSFTTQQDTHEVGPPGRKKTYITPAGWTRYGLKVLGKYHDDAWLHPFGNDGSWYRAFHGTRNAKAEDFGNRNASFDAQYACVDAGAGIYEDGFGKARVHVYGEGVYCSPKPTFIENRYAGVAKLDTKLGKKTFKIMLQVAVNPDDVKFANDDIWVALHPESIRTYGILIKDA